MAAHATVTNSGTQARRVAELFASIAGAFLLVFSAGPLRADELPQPTGRVILTLTGAIANTNAPGRAELDRAMLAEIGLVTQAIDTQWTDAGSRFEGVPARALLAYVGASGQWAEAIAANDYRVDVPIADLIDHPTLLALSMNGKQMRLRDKGPVWLLYDNDDRPDIVEDDLIARMVWQLRVLNIVE